MNHLSTFSASPIYFIAEIGFNHEGSLELCKKHVIEAHKAGANAIKLQSFSASDIALPTHEHHKLIEDGEFSYEQHVEKS